MITLSWLLLVGGIATYLVIAAWTFGYVCGKWSEESQGTDYVKQPNWWYDEPGPWFAGGAWPIYLLFTMVLWRVLQAGQKRAMITTKQRKIRIELEKKIRVEQEKIQQEIESELENMDAEHLKA